MDFNLSEQQELLKKSARDFLTKECPPKLVKEMTSDEKGYPPELWNKMAELGWMGLPIPEEFDGAGASFFDLFVLLEEMGRACLPGPFFSSIVYGGLALQEAGSQAQKAELLPQVAEGKLILTVALTEGSGRYEPKFINTKAESKNGGYSLTGRKVFVPDAHVADYIIVAARTSAALEGITLFLVDSKSTGITCNKLPTLAGDKQFEVVLDNVAVPKENVLGEVDKGWDYIKKTLEKVTVCKCAEMLGGAQRSLDMAIDYAKERVQFGRPIGSFQVIQFYCVDMATAVDGCRYIAYRAAWELDEGIPCSRDISIAKAWISDAYREVVSKSNQVHASISYTEDHDLPLYFKRAKTYQVWFGDAEYHRELIAQHVLD